MSALEFKTAQRMREAALEATRVLPDGAGEMVARELREWADFGYTLSPDGPVMRAVRSLLGEPK